MARTHKAERQIAEKRAAISHRMRILQALGIVADLRVGGHSLDMCVSEAARNTGMDDHTAEIKSAWTRL